MAVCRRYYPSFPYPANSSFLFSGVCTRGAYAPNQFGWEAILYLQRLHPPWEYSLPQSDEVTTDHLLLSRQEIQFAGRFPAHAAV